MRRLLLLIVAVLSLASIYQTQSQILLNENINYPAGDSLTAHGWTWINSYVNTVTVATGNLSYSGYTNSGIGNMVRLHNTGQDVYRQHDSVNVNNIYVSFLIRVDSVQATGDYFFALLPSTNTSNYTMRTFIKSSGAGFQIGISKSTEAVTYAPATYNLGTTYLIVVKYTFNSGTNQDDQLSLYVLSGAIPGTEPAPVAGPITGTQVDSPNISRIALRQGSASNAPTLDIDGFTVFRTWGNLVGINNISTVAENFSLSQNYPNPFNPSTKINFSLPERSFVTLKVYDMLGKEVMQLVNSDYSAGTYAVDMNAAGLSTGIYIYSIEATTETGNIFKDTKKLTLVK
ncbi:MAG: fibronectin type III domain-containing protein [Chlorobi bacterium OLB5]|nr:MAG: fibronectin type III domain-containing protein [Chlorobi bacterium OLB5]